MPDEPVRVDALAAIWLGGERALGQPVGRRAARRPFRRARRRRLFQVRRPAHRRLRPVEAAARAGPGQPGSRTSARSPISRTSCRTPRAHRRHRGRARLRRRRPQHRRFGQPPHLQIRRTNPLLARSRRRSRSIRPSRPPDPRRPPRQRADRRLLQDVRVPRRHCQISPRRDRGPTATIGSSFFTQRRRDARRRGADRARRLGRHERRPVSRPERPSERRREISPRQHNRQLGLFTLQSLVRGPIRFEAGARIEFARLHADEDAARSRRTAEIDRNAVPLIARASRQSRLRSARITSSSKGWRAGLSLSHSERAPSIDELSRTGRTAAASSS